MTTLPELTKEVAELNKETEREFLTFLESDGVGNELDTYYIEFKGVNVADNVKRELIDLLAHYRTSAPKLAKASQYMYDALIELRESGPNILSRGFGAKILNDVEKIVGEE